MSSQRKLTYYRALPLSLERLEDRNLSLAEFLAHDTGSGKL